VSSTATTAGTSGSSRTTRAGRAGRGSLPHFAGRLRSHAYAIVRDTNIGALWVTQAALPFLRAADESDAAVAALIDELVTALRIAVFASGARTIAGLRDTLA